MVDGQIVISTPTILIGIAMFGIIQGALAYWITSSIRLADQANEKGILQTVEQKYVVKEIYTIENKNMMEKLILIHGSLENVNSRLNLISNRQNTAQNQVVELMKRANIDMQLFLDRGEKERD